MRRVTAHRVQKLLVLVAVVALFSGSIPSVWHLAAR